MTERPQKRQRRTKAAAVRPPGGKATHEVIFEIEAEPGSEVYVAGSFNGWNPTLNRLEENEGLFVTRVQLPRGRHEYKFVVNDAWCVDPMCAEWTRNPFGSLNSVIVVD